VPTASARAIHSAAKDDATDDFVFGALHETAPPPALNTYPYCFVFGALHETAPPPALNTYQNDATGNHTRREKWWVLGAINNVEIIFE
jgi:hypothetical protein